MTALFGPSGCGKTTVLRCVAGLQTLRDGYLSIGDEVWQDGADFRPPHERSVGYVFQEASLFPHLSVRGNLLYGHRRALRRGTAEGARLDEVVALLGMEGLLERSPLRLSGGERQRVAVGRRNLLYGHRRAARRGVGQATRFDDVVELLGMENLVDRSPLRLSGGERQRSLSGVPCSRSPGCCSWTSRSPDSIA